MKCVYRKFNHVVTKVVKLCLKTICIVLFLNNQIMLKHTLKKQELRRQNDIVNQIFEIVIKRVEQCQTMRLKHYDVPKVFQGYPMYDTYKLYHKLVSHYSQDFDINIVDGQLVIIWEKEQPKVHPEFKAILDKINIQIEKAIDNDSTEVLYEIPILISGIPLYDFNKTTNSIIKFLREEGFYVEQVNKTSILISWRTAKLVPEKKKNLKMNSEDKELKKGFDNSFNDYEKRLKKLKKFNKQFKKTN